MVQETEKRAMQSRQTKRRFRYHEQRCSRKATETARAKKFQTVPASEIEDKIEFGRPVDRWERRDSRREAECGSPPEGLLGAATFQVITWCGRMTRPPVRGSSDSGRSLEHCHLYVGRLLQVDGILGRRMSKPHFDSMKEQRHLCSLSHKAWYHDC